MPPTGEAEMRYGYLQYRYFSGRMPHPEGTIWQVWKKKYKQNAIGIPTLSHKGLSEHIMIEFSLKKPSESAGGEGSQDSGLVEHSSCKGHETWHTLVNGCWKLSDEMSNWSDDEGHFVPDENHWAVLWELSKTLGIRKEWQNLLLRTIQLDRAV